MDKELKTANDIVTALAKWSRKYPRGGIYHHSRQAGMDGELIAIEQAAARIADEETFPSISLHDLTQLVCGELPEGFEMEIHLENGYGGVKLEMDDGGEVEGDELADSNLETQIIELVKLAKGEPSDYTYEGWPSREQP